MSETPCIAVRRLTRRLPSGGRLLTILDSIDLEIARGESVAIFSASPEFYLTPFVHSISPDIAVFGSVVEERSGQLQIHNLFREGKAAKAREFIASRTAAHVCVYTDHWHDLSLMRLAERVVLVGPTPATVSAVRRAGIAFETIAA